MAFATVALQYPDLAVEQLEDGIKRLGLRDVSIGGSVNGEELSDPKFHPFWAKAEELDVLVFLHPQDVPDLAKRLQGNGLLTNVIGNPLETTIALSHLIFEGTLDRFPGLKLCAAHGGGYLPSYSARSDHDLVAEALSTVSVQDVTTWVSEHVGETMQSKRRREFPCSQPPKLGTETDEPLADTG